MLSSSLQDQVGARASSRRAPWRATPKLPTWLDRRYVVGSIAGLLLGAALGVPVAYALLGLGGAARGGDALSQLLDPGMHALARKDYAQALAIFRVAERSFPFNSRVQNNICATLNRLGRFDEAVLACKAALALEPGLKLARNNLWWAQAQLARSAARAATKP